MSDRGPEPVPPPGPELVEVVRGRFVEARHRGALVLLDRDGSVARRVGSTDVPLLPRSALKPVQALALVESGFAGTGEALAVAAASHTGERVHVRAVRDVLAGAGVQESALRCPAALPADRAALLAHVGGGVGGGAGGGVGPEPVCHPCSGKHAAMLATAAAAGWDLATYCDPGHPVQRAVRDVVDRECGPSVGETADGCGVPALAVSLTGLARAFRGLATAAPDTPAGRVRAAMRAHPRLVKDHGRSVTDLTRAVPGLVCKDGAEGVWAAALADGRAVAAKLDDGGVRALPPLLAAVLTHWGVTSGDGGAAVRRWSATPVLGGGETVGYVRGTLRLAELLDP